MRMRIVFIIAAIIFLGSPTRAQSLYSIQYRFTTIQDTSLYNVFLVNNEDGTGFYRVRFFDPQTKDYMIVELDMTEEFYINKRGKIDTTKMLFRGSKPQVIYGDKDYYYYPEQFWFALDRYSGWYEPWGVTSPDEKGFAEGVFVGKPALLEDEDLTEEYMSQFFLPEEEIYKSLFATTQKSLTPEQKRTNMHLILVANTEDESIGAACATDKARVLKTYKDICGLLQINFVPTEIFGDSYSKENVQKSIAALRPGPQDIVVFYYTGHGFSSPNPARLYPDMALSNKGYEDARANSLNIEDVYNEVKKKGARFNLVYSDCCNNDLDDKPSLTCDAPRMRSSGLGWSLENCKFLFMNDKPTSILMTASERGQLSSCNGLLGGFFTHQFRNSLVNNLGPLHLYPTWESILKESRQSTIEQAEKTRCNSTNEAAKVYKQFPVWKVQR